jgi:hypothetical protein
LGAGVPVLTIAMAVAALAAVAGVTAGVRHAPPPGQKAIGHGLLGVGAALLVLLLQFVSVGASLGGAVLALAVGGMSVLVLMLVRGG